MKNKITLTSLLLFLCLNAFAKQPFITTWGSIFGGTLISFEAVTTGPVAYSWVTLPPAAAASGSGTFEGTNVTIPGLPQGASIRLSIQPQNFKRFILANNSTFSEINQWGTVEWISMENAFTTESFFGSSLIAVTATDIPNLSNVTSMANMFSGCGQLNGPFNINFWNISNVTNLSGMFRGCFNFNQALSLWNTSNVTDMSSMFEGAVSFNQNIGTWNTSNVTNLRKMFKDAESFNRNISNWNTANVTDMSEMFSWGIFNTTPYGFNQNIGNWNTSNVTNMAGMFNGAVLFNQNIGNWNTSNVTDMSNMFNNAFSFNQNLGNWNTANVTTMANMFRADFNGFLVPFSTLSSFTNGGSNAIQNWNTANVTDMSGIFFKAENFNYNLGNWNISSVTNMSEMIDRSGLDCRNYSQTLIAWNANPNTPNNIVLGATFLEYGLEAIPAINNLVFNKGWGFSGHDFISTIPSFDFQTTYCQGSSIPPLPTVSTDGISGSWIPALNNTTTTTYSFIPNDDECAITSVVTISITPSIDPVFTEVSPICSGEVLAALPTSSNNGIIGFWSPALNNTATTTYTFTPNSGQCASTTSLTVIVNQAATPSGDSNQTFSANSTLSSIVISPVTVIWYASLNDALANLSPLPSDFLLQDGVTYYAINVDGECRSEPFAVTVSLTLSVANNEFSNFVYYPNPVNSILNIANNTVIKQVEIYSLLGQFIRTKIVNDMAFSIELSDLPKSIYLVKVKSENGSKEFKISKL
ncbi:BspA family leucine-rich repeat surface protein [Flavobacterium lacus]|uniref:Putative secreted protein (Por secretion system target) n=1 Tax=Flavobacterium lacus TaxID=1353778 RepID=A0A328WQP2_9FLAO|nr:BspA family leucine-rich repeat surface protein [Flavobacterium lacus]RAR47456.1 putative secreted protein (Por secretion system target) [Flavobacterium lacus]